jgi:hypothetical protein
MLQMVVRNYTPTDLKVAGDITTTDSNYLFLGLKLHTKNDGVSYAQATISREVSRKKHRTCRQHRFKAGITRKATNEQKLHNFDLNGGT